MCSLGVSFCVSIPIAFGLVHILKNSTFWSLYLLQKHLHKRYFLKTLPSANTWGILFLLWTTFCNNIYKNSVFVVGLPSATTFVGIFSLLWDYLLQQLCCGTIFCNNNICRNSLFVVGPPSATTFVGIPSLLWDWDYLPTVFGRSH